MSTYLRPTELAKYLDVAPQKISQLRARGIITLEQDGSYDPQFACPRRPRRQREPHRGESPATPCAPRADGTRDRPHAGRDITPEEDERRLEMIRSRLEDIPAGYAKASPRRRGERTA